MFRKYVFYFYWLLVIYIVAGFVWWYIIIHQQTKEIVQLKFATHQIKKQIIRKHTQYAGEGIVLLGIIILGSFVMYRLLKKEVYISKKEKIFMLGITHEMKTPITAIMLNLETLRNRQCSTELKNDLITDSIEELIRLNNFYDNIMLSAQFEETISKKNYKKINLIEILNSVINKYNKNNINFISDFKLNKITIRGDQYLWELCFMNIFSNAIKYSDNNKEVTIKSYQHNAKNILEFCDQGIGISISEKNNVFNKFYRTENGNLKTSQGSGLGLFIVKKIILQHKCKIQILDNKPKGTIFKIII